MVEKIRQLRVLTLAMRRVAVPAVVAVALAISVFGCNGENATGDRTFNSKLSLRVFAGRDADGGSEEIGRTPSSRPLVIPKGTFWFVIPTGPVDMRVLAKEIESKEISGLSLDDATDADLAHLKGLTKLQYLCLSSTKITDAGLVHLKGLTGLRELQLDYTEITDAGLAHLKGLTNLQGLDLSDTEITDVGLAHMKGLTELQWLYLGDTKITDAGLVYMKGLTELQDLNLWGTEITDAGLAQLKGLTELQKLNLWATKVTDAGVDSLRKALPEADIRD